MHAVMDFLVQIYYARARKRFNIRSDSHAGSDRFREFLQRSFLLIRLSLSSCTVVRVGGEGAGDTPGGAGDTPG